MNFVFPAKLHEEKANIIFLVPLTVGSLIDGHLPSCIICLRDLAHVLEGSLWLVEPLFIIHAWYCSPYYFIFIVPSLSEYRELRAFIHEMVRGHHWIRGSFSTWGPASYTPTAKENIPNSTEVDFLSEIELFGIWNLAFNYPHGYIKMESISASFCFFVFQQIFGGSMIRVSSMIWRLMATSFLFLLWWDL